MGNKGQIDMLADCARGLPKATDVGARLYNCRTRQQILDTILQQARNVAGAEAGSLYLVHKGQLRFVAVQNEQMNAAQIAQHLLGHELPITADSLAGFVALSGRTINIPDSYTLPAGVPFHINRDLDTKTGYRVRGILAIPLDCPDGERIGVMELFNCKDAQDQAVAFPQEAGESVLSLASTVAITLHNYELQEQLRRVHLNTIFRLSTIAEYRDADTANHVQRVSRTSELLAEAMGLPANEVQLIKCASPMHDVGKVAIPDAILLKPGHLTPKQRKFMEKHTTGAAIFYDPEDIVIRMARDIALYHHERLDGQGYPNELTGESIPVAGRIVGLADVFDAIVSHRVYKSACSLDVALAIIDEDTGKHFDPKVVKAFQAVMGQILESYPTLQAT